MPNTNFFQQNSTTPSEKTELSKRQHPAYPESAKFNRDYYPNRWRQHRPHAGGFFSSVEYGTRGFMLGVRGLQHGVSRNKRVEFQRLDSSTQQFLLPTKTKRWSYTMIKPATTGESRQRTAPQLRFPSFIGNCPSIPKHLRNKALSLSSPLPNTLSNYHALEFFPMGSSVMCTRGPEMVAWIHQGYAGSARNSGACTFYDVAFPSPTFGQQERITGLLLNSDCFDSLVDAVQFVESTFANGRL